MTRHPTSGDLGSADVAVPVVTQRTTGKLLATRGYVVGIEISSSGARRSVALADLNGRILHRVRHPLDYVPDTPTVLSQLDEMLSEVLRPEHLQDGRVLRVGIAVGGLVDARRGVVQRLHHAHGWDNFPLQDYFAERLDAPCIIDNNANAVALAEVKQGVGRGERVVLYVGLGRGIGGGLVVNGRIYHGITGTAGEIGHLQVKEDGPPCSCGGHGHLEAVASGQAIVQTMLRQVQEYAETRAAIQQITNGLPERLTAEQVFQLAAGGDKIAHYVVHDVYQSLSIALTNIVHLINPGMIILGGPVALAGERLLAPLTQGIQKLCLPAACQSLRVVLSSLGSEANLVGAVTLALQDI